MITKLKILVAITLVSLVVLLSACAVTTTPPTSTTPTTTPASSTTPTPTESSNPSPVPPITNPTFSSLEIMVTDAPPDAQVTSIMVTVPKIEIHRAGEPVHNEGEEEPTEAGTWISIDVPAEAQTFDLLKVKGIEQLITSGEFATGLYTQLRLNIDDVKVSIDNGELQAATVSDGEIKLVQNFEIKDGETTILVLDFDADAMVNITGTGDIQVKPVIKLTTRQEPKGAEQVPGEQIAENFLKNSSTFAFDGMPETLRLMNTERVNTRSIFTFQFSCRHGGYGDRTGQNVTEAITPHWAVITVENEQVTYGVIDGKWDMLTDKAIPQYTDENVTIKTVAGEEFIIALESNPTTGYSWTEEYDETLLSLINSQYVADDTGLIGSGGTQYFHFKALESGDTQITLTYKRAWETEAAQQKIFQVTIAEPPPQYTDENITIMTTVDGEFIIALEANASTGYSWIEEHDAALLSLVNSQYVDKNPGVPGAPGTQYFQFRALENGDTEITLTYKRSWETEATQQKVFKVSIAPQYTDGSITISTTVGEVFTIALEANATTGFAWIEEHDDTLLGLVNSQYVPEDTDLVGSGGTQYFQFKALESGNTQITLTYKQAWETDFAQQKVFTVIIS